MTTTFRDILATLKENELTSQKFHHVESSILSVLNYRDFFEILLSEIMVTFNLPFVWVSLIRNREVTDMIIQAMETSQMASEKLSIVDENVFIGILGEARRPVLVNRELKPYFALFPADRHYLVKSLAVIPILLDGEVIGSLNFGDPDRERFKPGFDTILLDRLALKTSICLSNVTAHEKLKYLAYHDSLTGLLNRRVMLKVLEREFERSRRYGSHLSLVFMDLDRFKGINDQYGHDTGDRLLVHLAGILKKMVRSSDIVSRLAGDEFVLILPETGAEQSTRLMRRILGTVEASPLPACGSKIPFTFSFGISSTETGDALSPADLLKQADTRLYQSKAEKGGIISQVREPAL